VGLYHGGQAVNHRALQARVAARGEGRSISRRMDAVAATREDRAPVYRRSKGIFGHSRHERQLLRVVSDRRVLSVPLNDEAEATWLAGRLMKDFVGLSPASR
jgi:hypothetical protein